MNEEALYSLVPETSYNSCLGCCFISDSGGCSKPSEFKRCLGYIYVRNSDKEPEESAEPVRDNRDSIIGTILTLHNGTKVIAVDADTIPGHCCDGCYFSQPGGICTANELSEYVRCSLVKYIVLNDPICDTDISDITFSKIQKFEL